MKISNLLCRPCAKSVYVHCHIYGCWMIGKNLDLILHRISIEYDYCNFSHYYNNMKCLFCFESYYIDYYYYSEAIIFFVDFIFSSCF